MGYCCCFISLVGFCGQMRYYCHWEVRVGMISGRYKSYSWRPLKEKMRVLWKTKSFGQRAGTTTTVKEPKSQEAKSYQLLCLCNNFFCIIYNIICILHIIWYMIYVIWYIWSMICDIWYMIYDICYILYIICYVCII